MFTAAISQTPSKMAHKPPLTPIANNSIANYGFGLLFGLAVLILILPLGVNADSDSSSDDADTARSVTASAQAAIDKGKYNKALKKLKRLKKKHPDNADVFNLLGYSQRKLGNFDDSLIHYKKALSIDPEHRGALEYLGELYLKLDDVPNAEKQAALLKSVCGMSCEELLELEDAITVYKSK